MTNTENKYIHAGDDIWKNGYIKFPAALFKNEKIKKMSSGAKVLYIALLSRLSLSEKNGWKDTEGNVYVYFTISDVTDYLGCCKEKAVKLFSELDEKTGTGLIRRKRNGFGKPSSIYFNDVSYYDEKNKVKRVLPGKELTEANLKEGGSTKSSDEISDAYFDTADDKRDKAESLCSEYVCPEDICPKDVYPEDRGFENASFKTLDDAKDKSAYVCREDVCLKDIYPIDTYGEDMLKNGSYEFDGAENPTPIYEKTESENSEKQNTDFLINRTCEVGETDSNYNNIKYINKKYINNNYNQSVIGFDGGNEKNKDKKYYKNLVKGNIGYNSLIGKIPMSRLDEFVSIISDILETKDKYIKVGGHMLEAKEVKERFSNLDSDHIRYVYESFKNVTTSVYNVRSYIITALYRSHDSVALWTDVEHNILNN